MVLAAIFRKTSTLSASSYEKVTDSKCYGALSLVSSGFVILKINAARWIDKFILSGHDPNIDRGRTLAAVRFEAERNSLSQRRIGNQPLLLGVEIDTPERVLLMTQGYIPIDLALIHRYEAYLQRKEEKSSTPFASSSE